MNKGRERGNFEKEIENLKEIAKKRSEREERNREN